MSAVSLRDTVVASADAASWLTPADNAALELALKIATHIDYLPDEASARDLAVLSNALNGVLKDLGLSVAGRSAKPTPPREVSPLDALRAAGPVRIADPTPAKSAK